MAELMVGLAAFTIAGSIAYSILLNSSFLFAKNISVNSSNTILRTALDRLTEEMNQGYGIPKLINSDGTSVASSGPAPGITFDDYVGGPYVVTNTLGGTGIPSNATSFLLKTWVDPFPFPPAPVSDDAVCIETSIGTVRLRVASCNSSPNPAPSPPPAPYTRISTVTLPSPIGGGGIAWSAGTVLTGFVVHKKALILATINGGTELRLYDDAEGLATASDYSNAANYVILTRSLSGTSGENQPFSLTTQSGHQFLSIALRGEHQQYNRVLSNKQKGEFNTFLRVDTMSYPRNAY